MSSSVSLFCILKSNRSFKILKYIFLFSLIIANIHNRFRKLRILALENNHHRGIVRFAKGKEEGLYALSPLRFVKSVYELLRK